MRMLTSRLHILKENIIVSCSLLNISLLSSVSTSVPSATSPLLPLPQLLVPAIPTLHFQEVTFVDSISNGICPPAVEAGCSSLRFLSGPLSPLLLYPRCTALAGSHHPQIQPPSGPVTASSCALSYWSGTSRMKRPSLYPTWMHDFQ